jgi:FAD:protein FMN transferase
MGMHVTVEVVDKNVSKKHLDKIYDYFKYIDEKFSTYKDTSEISQINNGLIPKNKYSLDMKKILLLSEQTKKDTNGYFDIFHNGKLDPSGLVKGWSIWQAEKILRRMGFKNFYIDAGGDIGVFGRNSNGEPWKIGIRNPFNSKEIIKVVSLKNKGIATSGTSIRGQHIYNPLNSKMKTSELVSLSVIGPNVYEADRFATAAFAIGLKGIYFIERVPKLEAYLIDKDGIATYTTGFNKYVI